MPRPNRISTLLLLFIVLMGIACTDCTGRDQKSEQASSSYKTEKDYASLELISRHLHTGMTRSEVEELLGKADYSPIEGQEYYSSDRRETAGSGKKQVYVTVGLIVEYRNDQGELTGQVQKFWLGRIGE